MGRTLHKISQNEGSLKIIDDGMMGRSDVTLQTDGCEMMVQGAPNDEKTKTFCEWEGQVLIMKQPETKVTIKRLMRGDNMLLEITFNSAATVAHVFSRED